MQILRWFITICAKRQLPANHNASVTKHFHQKCRLQTRLLRSLDVCISMSEGSKDTYFGWVSDNSRSRIQLLFRTLLDRVFINIQTYTNNNVCISMSEESKDTYFGWVSDNSRSRIRCLFRTLLDGGLIDKQSCTKNNGMDMQSKQPATLHATVPSIVTDGWTSNNFRSCIHSTVLVIDSGCWHHSQSLSRSSPCARHSLQRCWSHQVVRWPLLRNRVDLGSL